MGLLLVIAMAEPEAEESASLPGIELLEFLGSWETASGDWIDPTAFADVYAEQEKAPQGTGKHDC